jgi:hypothetical protein
MVAELGPRHEPIKGETRKRWTKTSIEEQGRRLRLDWVVRVGWACEEVEDRCTAVVEFEGAEVGLAGVFWVCPWGV